MSKYLYALCWFKEDTDLTSWFQFHDSFWVMPLSSINKFWVHNHIPIVVSFNILHLYCKFFTTLKVVTKLLVQSEYILFTLYTVPDSATFCAFEVPSIHTNAFISSFTIDPIDSWVIFMLYIHAIMKHFKWSHLSHTNLNLCKEQSGSWKSLGYFIKELLMNLELFLWMDSQCKLCIVKHM